MLHGFRVWFESVCTLDGQLNKKDAKRQAMCLIFALIAMSFAFLALLGMLFHYDIDEILIRSFATLLLVVAMFVTIGAILHKCRLTDTIIVCVVYVSCVSVFLIDLDGRSVATPNWPMLIIAVDLLLVLQVPSKYSVAIVVFTMFWLVLMAVESHFRFGLLDLPGLVPQDHRRKHFALMTDCAELPCGTSFPFESLLVSLAVFGADFYVTRGFADEVLKEQEAMAVTIEVVHEIASLLAGYDVEGVARMLAVQETELPEGMHETLKTLERNLRKYRAYLPAALFEDASEEPGLSPRSVAVAPPGLETGEATIVFTDIRSSTWIWEHAPVGMAAGLRIHNRIIRDVIHMFHGYEVKSIGDSFMVAFATTADGVGFGLKVHELLQTADWPESLLEHPICNRCTLWGGLTVRIGVNSGKVELEESPLTGRTDYFGHVVNVASRLESSCRPGAVAVPALLWKVHCASHAADIDEAEDVRLPGVSGLTSVSCLWPPKLAGRAQHPLPGPLATTLVEDLASLHSTINSSCSSMASAPKFCETKFEATVGAVELVASGPGEDALLRNMSLALTTLSAALEQSRGTLVTVLGSRVCVGWNLARPELSHAEGAIRFAQHLQQTKVLRGAGIVTGMVRHGDVNARTQRFVTVIGSTVQRGWSLCEQALPTCQCLYEHNPAWVPLVPSLLVHVVPLDSEQGVYVVTQSTSVF